jgi:hypothetical protein
MNLTNSTETNSVATSTALDTLANRLAPINAAQNEFESKPLVSVRRQLRKPGQRFASVEQVEAHKSATFGAPRSAAMYDFLATVRQECGIGATSEDEAELARIAAEKEENAELERQFAVEAE